AINLQAGLNQIPGHIIGRSNLVSGFVEAKVTAHVTRENLRLEEFTATGTIANFRFNHEKTAIRGNGADSSVSFAISGSPLSQDYRLDGLSIIEPVSVSAAVTGSSSYTKGHMQAEGTVRSWIDVPVKLQTAQLPVPISYDLQLDTTSLNWQANLKGRYQQDQPLTLSRDDVTINVPEFSLSSSLSGNPDGRTGTVAFNCRPFSLSRNKTALDISEVSLKAQLQSSETLNAVHLSGSISEIKERSSGLKFTGITLDLPYHLPFSAQHKQDHGSIRVGSITVKDSPLFAVDARLLQQQRSLQLQASLTSLFSEALHLQVQGTVEQEPLQAQLSWALDKTALSPASLPPALPAMAGLDFEGSLASSGNLSYKNRQLSGTAQLQFEIDRFQVAEKNITINNISCGVTFPSLPAPFSLPSQRCTAAALEFGNLRFEDADLSFRVEDADTVFIEKSSVNWCQGKLESTSLRLSRSNPEINTALYCSKINFSDLLNQFGLDQAEGQGSLNGKLPIALSKSGLAFDEGFLFSTPGTGGIIRFSNTDMLRQGVGSADVGGYLDYSMKAMEDFAYQWTKLSFNSSGDELQLTMQLNGKPRTPLPYGLKNGTIVKTDKGEGLQYPIQLDVNFRLPLAELFQIGQNIQTMKENM
ncbi:MAG: YdbH domain-containing protein, partial [Desulfocapsaceae bacterium]|nr:YdbH domain-containing protein [Desulfocapsaceae bacterium]